jgi:hypothetical protein
MNPLRRRAALLVRLWRIDAPLTVTGLLMTAALLPLLAGVWLDPRTIAGAPAWLKPAKFAASTAIYSFTLAWIFGYLPAWPRTRRVVGRTTAAVFIIEVGFISFQAARGTTSHFNVATPLDAVLWTVMGTAIALQTLTSLGVLVAAWRQPFADLAVGWAIRLGLAITIAGAASGGLMTQPTDRQISAAIEHGRMTVAGAHTVGAPDGTPELPGTGWSRTHGDLRVGHFLGLHALQVLPLLAWALGRRRALAARRTALVAVGAGSYAALAALLTIQALRAQPLTGPDVLTLQLLATWIVLTAGALWFVMRPRTQPVRPPNGAHHGC